MQPRQAGKHMENTLERPEAHSGQCETLLSCTSPSWSQPQSQHNLPWPLFASDTKHFCTGILSLSLSLIIFSVSSQLKDTNPIKKKNVFQDSLHADFGYKACLGALRFHLQSLREPVDGHRSRKEHVRDPEAERGGSKPQTSGRLLCNGMSVAGKSLQCTSALDLCHQYVTL